MSTVAFYANSVVQRFPGAVIVALCLAAVGACDSGFDGEPGENRAPDTELSVRDTSLVDNIDEMDRLASTVFVSWSGTDPDGYVAEYQLRYFSDASAPDAEQGWTTTSRNDSLVLLPLEVGESTANVVFEVRSVDNEGAVDETPARTIFPIRNSPPSIRFDPAEMPPDTTFGFVSFAWFANDPEGIESISRVEISVNDTVNFVQLPGDVDFITLVADVDKEDPAQQETNAEIFIGRALQSTTLTVPGLRLGAQNTFYARAVDLTDTTSARIEITWHVKKSNSDILFVNDHRSSAADSRDLQVFHLGILSDYLPQGERPDTWDISAPYTGIQSPLLLPSADPTLRLMFEDYDYIYWLSTNTTNSIVANNFPFAATALGGFLDGGGRLMMHSPVQPPANPDDNIGNPALLVLPVADFITFPDSLVSILRLPTGAELSPSDGAPPFPDLRTRLPLLNAFPFIVESSTAQSLIDGTFEYRTQSGNRGTWTGPSTIAAISNDRQVGLFALPLINNFDGSQNFVGADGSPDAPRTTIMMILEMLEFPQ